MQYTNRLFAGHIEPARLMASWPTRQGHTDWAVSGASHLRGGYEHHPLEELQAGLECQLVEAALLQQGAVSVGELVESLACKQQWIVLDSTRLQWQHCMPHTQERSKQAAEAVPRHNSVARELQSPPCRLQVFNSHRPLLNSLLLGVR